MRDLDRIDPFLEELGELWKQWPDLRFGQLLSMIVAEWRYDIVLPEEEKWLEAIKNANNYKR